MDTKIVATSHVKLIKRSLFPLLSSPEQQLTLFGQTRLSLTRQLLNRRCVNGIYENAIVGERWTQQIEARTN